MEYLDIVDEQGQPTGEIVSRTLAHTKGIRHRTAHIWIVRRKNEHFQVLMQKRAMSKDSFPGKYDTSSAGHIQAGDEPLASGLRELAAGLLPLDKQIQIEKNVFENYPMLVRDRVELSEEYLAVIDEVERLLEEECGENAHPLETAQAKARLLSERGILWRSEMQLNPGVLFD